MKLEASLPLVLLAGGLTLLSVRRSDPAPGSATGEPQVLHLLMARLFLFNLLAFSLYLLRGTVNPKEELIWIFQIVTALFLTAAVPLGKVLGISLPGFPSSALRTRLPEGFYLGMSVPGYALFPLLLISLYALYLDSPFLILNLTALWAVALDILILKVSGRALRELLPVIPAFTGFSLLLALGLSTDVGEVSFYVSSLFEERLSFLFTVLLMFLLGFLTGIGPSTLPFLPLVFGTLIARRKGKAEIAVSVGGFVLAFIATHSLAGALASAGAFMLNDIFRVGIFNLVLALLLMFIALSLLSLIPLRLELSRINPFRNPGMNSFLLGVAYTFSLCPSCASLLLGAVILSASAESAPLSALHMGVYAVGRAVPVFLSGLVVGSLSDFLRRNHVYINRLVGLLFLFLSLYFLSNFLEVFV